jgi:hypothetical protein
MFLPHHEQPPDCPADQGGHAHSMAPARPARLNSIALAHGVAFSLQALLFSRLLDLDADATARLLATFALGGASLALLWRWWATMPHWLDMSWGMAGVGALGMYFGIWADHQFGPIADLESRLWTYGCMLLACNLAMMTLTHHAHHHHFTDVGFLSMMIGGNAGMIVGMQAGKRVVTIFPLPPGPIDMGCRLLGMSFGMILGMLIGYVAMLSLCRRTTTSGGAGPRRLRGGPDAGDQPRRS